MKCFIRIAEVCKHIGALLYHISSEVRKGNNKTCTSKQQAWGVPSSKLCKRYTATPLNDIPLKKSKIRSSVAVLPSKTVIGCRSNFDPRALADRNPMSFTKADYQNLDVACNGKCTLLQYNDELWDNDFNPSDSTNVAREELISPNEVSVKPQPITRLAGEIAQQMACHSVEEKITAFHSKLCLTAQQQQRIVKLTKGQSATSEWAKFRTGVITATKLLPVVRKYDSDMNVKNQASAKNLAVDILQYKSNPSTKAMQWGIANEPIAMEKYRRVMTPNHKHFSVKETGLTISMENPFLGASPDGLVTCSCCGDGLAEFKVPWTLRDKTVVELAKAKGTCLELTSSQCTRLRRSHEYFYQIQMQLAVTHSTYCDFFLLTSKDYHLERIVLDKNLWQSALPKLRAFFDGFILQELFEPKLLVQVIVKQILNEIINRI